MSLSSSPQTNKATREALHDTLQEIAAISTQISQLESRLQSLESEAALYKSKLAPWRMLPDDMLIEIFERCTSPGCAPMSIKAAPLVLTLVCKHWRAITLSTNSLWSKVHFVIPASLGRKTAAAARYHARVQALSNWLQQSGSLPITITIAKLFSPVHSNSEWTQDDVGHRAFRALFRVLTAHASHLRSVSFPHHSEDLGPSKMPSISEALRFPMLEHISSPTESVLRHWDLALQASNLRDVALMLRTVPNPKTLLESRAWSQLNHLEIYDWCSSWTLLGLLSHCPSLLSLTAFCGVVEDDGQEGYFIPYTAIPQFSQIYLSSGRQPVLLPRLHTFKVEGAGTHALVAGLQAPALKHASCSQMEQPIEVDRASDFSLGRLPTATPMGPVLLQSLSLRISNPSIYMVDSLVKFLRTQDELRLLELNVDIWNGTVEQVRALSKLHEKLTINETMPVPLPMLEQFDLMGICDGSVDATLAFLESRLTGSTEHSLQGAKISLHRVAIELGRRTGMPLDDNSRASSVTRDSLVKMKEFMMLRGLDRSRLSVVIVGAVTMPQYAAPGVDLVGRIDPFHGLESFDRRYDPYRRTDTPEVFLEEFFQEDNMVSWSREEEDSSGDQLSDIEL